MDVAHRITRVRGETRRRRLTVASIEAQGDALLRIWFVGQDLEGFVSEALDGHVKLFLPDGAGGVSVRDYTPRLYDAAAQALAIEFALRKDESGLGPATGWAMDAQPGDTPEIGGPRASAIVPDDFDWYLLVGDETALPALSRRLEELRDDVEAIVLISTIHAEPRPELPARRGLRTRWIEGSASPVGDALVKALACFALSPGDGFVWIAAEGTAAQSIRTYMVEERGHPKAWIKASGYWVSGRSGAHTRIDQ